jgi:hypothetical protein
LSLEITRDGDRHVSVEIRFDGEPLRALDVAIVRGLLGSP